MFFHRDNNAELEAEKLKRKIAVKFSLIVLGISVLLIIGTVLIWKVVTGSFADDIQDNAKEAVSELIVGNEGEVTTITKSSLEKVFTISELSTADYDYNAIAYAYAEDGVTEVYYVAYKGTVKAGIDFRKIEIQVDDEKKEILLKIPECEIQDTTVEFGSMEYIFADETYHTETVSQQAYELCRADLAERVKQEPKFMGMAKENAIMAVEALVLPWIEQIDAEYEVIIQ